MVTTQAPVRGTFLWGIQSIRLFPKRYLSLNNRRRNLFLSPLSNSLTKNGTDCNILKNIYTKVKHQTHRSRNSTCSPELDRIFDPRESFAETLPVIASPRCHLVQQTKNLSSLFHLSSSFNPRNCRVDERSSVAFRPKPAHPRSEKGPTKA